MTMTHERPAGADARGEPARAAGDLSARVAALEAAFNGVAATRMNGVPVMNRRLRVQAIGFEPWAALAPADAPGAADARPAPAAAEALGILITPWFMNLVRLPLDPAGAAAMPGVGVSDWRRIGADPVEFIGAHEEAIGRFAAASLFSPMFEFADHATACATARQVLAALRGGPAAAATAAQAVKPAVAAARATAPADAVAARRGFLFGRGGRTGAAA